MSAVDEARLRVISSGAGVFSARPELVDDLIAAVRAEERERCIDEIERECGAGSATQVLHAMRR